jgi:hypothetical protein
MSHILDDEVQRTKPNSIVFTIAGGAIDYDNGDPTAADRKIVWARAGGKAVFTVQNNGDDPYEVTIPFGEFQPSKKHGDAPAEPIDKHSSPRDTVHVPAGGVDALVYVIKPAAHFRFSASTPALTYKYTLYYTNARTGVRTPLDPDLEVSP